MPLATFDVVYRAYAQIVEKSCSYGRAYEDFPHQPYKLLEAYSLAWLAEREKGLYFTSHWERQQGASTAALAMVMASQNVYVVVSDTRLAKNITNKAFKAFPKQGGNIHSHVRPNVIHKNVWWMSGLRNCVLSNQPDLVVVDSETAYRKDRDQAIDDLQRFLRCGIVVLDALNLRLL